MKKLLSVVIAALVVFAALPFAAAADEAELVPVSISVNMTGGNTMTEYRLGYTNTADPAALWYYYVISEILRALNPEITVYYKNGAPSRTFKYNDKSEIEQESGWSITDKDVPEQTCEKHWAAGDTVTFKHDYMGADCDITFTIEEFPVVSVSARATKTIMEGQKGVKQDENGNEFEWYNPSFAEPTVTLELADGMVEEYTYDNFYRIYEK